MDGPRYARHREFLALGPHGLEEARSEGRDSRAIAPAQRYAGQHGGRSLFASSSLVGEPKSIERLTSIRATSVSSFSSAQSLTRSLRERR